MIFNDIDFSTIVKVEDIRKSLLPPLTNTLKKIPGKRGNKFIRNEMGAGLVEIDIRLITADIEAKVRELAGKLYTDEPKKLIYKDKYNYAILDGDTKLERMLYTGFATLNFICPDPVDYGQTITAGIGTLNNNGTSPATGTITVEITEPVSNLQVALNTGEIISVIHNFVIGDTVRIDLEDEMIYKNGDSIMYDCNLESDFFEIPTGEFTITVNTGTTTIEYIERWL